MSGCRPNRLGPEHSFRWPAALFGLVWAVWVRSAHASVEDLYGSGVRGPAMAGALTAASDGPESTFYNPAALAGSDRLVIATGFSIFIQDLNAGAAGGAEDPDVGVRAGISGRIPFGGPLQDRLFFGLVLHVPTDNARIMRIVLPGIEEPFFLPYQNATERAVVAPGLGIRLTSWLRLGIGLELHLLDSPNLVTGGLGRSNSFELSTDLKLLTDFVPRAGLELSAGELSPALEGWSLGIAFRERFDESFSLPSYFDLGFQATLSVSGRSFFVPREVVGGVAWRPSPGWLLSADLAWEGWSDLMSPRIRVLVAGLDGLIPVPELAAIESLAPDPGVHDTFSPRIGVEWDLGAAGLEWPITLRSGYAYEPSPGDPKDDALLFFNSRQVFSAGIGWAPGEPWFAPDEPRLELEAFVQAHVLATEKRSVPADASPTGEPIQVEGKGWLGVFGVDVRVTF